MASQTLSSLVVRLQQVMSVAQGRTMVLDYARKSCGARLALLFVLENERRVLTLLEHSGRHPHTSSSSPKSVPATISLQGLFASALNQPNFLDVPDISHHPLALPEERAWAWSGGRVLLHTLRQGPLQGVLVFCFSPSGSHIPLKNEALDDLLICASLLSAYLGAEEPQPERAYNRPLEGVAHQTRRGTRSQTTKSEQERHSEDSQERRASLTAYPLLQPDETLNLVAALCRLGLTTEGQIDELSLNQQILDLLCSALHSSLGCLWRYQSREKPLLLQGTFGDPGLFAASAATEIHRLLGTIQNDSIKPTYGLIPLPDSNGRALIWHTLICCQQFLGVLGVELAQEPASQKEQRLLLSTICDLVALLLLRYKQRDDERRALIEQERSRIAREIHDSIMQDVAHVLQKLDYIQRILEKQPQAALSEIEQARELLNRSLRDVSSSISSLLPAPLEEQEFDQALQALLHEYSLNSPHLKIIYDVDNLALWPQTLQAPIYRFMQEALNNIRKHASASEVHIRIRHIAGLGIVQVSDNGQGFVPRQMRKSSPDSATSTLHMGLQAMEERVRQVGGTFEIHSTPGMGTTLKARFPLTQSSALLTEREREVLRLMVDGLTNRAISERLSVSLETVKSHVHHIMQKMHVKDRTQAAVVATKQQWL